MIQGLDHVALIVRDLDPAVAAYEVLLGRRCEWRGADDGAGHAWFRLSNLALTIQAPTGKGPEGARLARRLEASGEGLGGIAFAVADMEQARRLLERRALAVSAERALRATHCGTGASAELMVADLAADTTHGVPMSIARGNRGDEGREPVAPAIGDAASAISGLDHVVIRSPCPERAVALIAGRLDLELRLDRSNPDWGARLLFFRCGDLIVEVAHNLATGVSRDPDELWGLSWRTPDIEATHRRLGAAGIGVSDIRVGRRPGTRVFTVKDRSARLPTLVLGRS
jgi:catechol 2,3-dioxygenase-like lactoylglutathione lyase family enzyme